ncbi:DNA repair protein RAD50, putative (macronuclear) [Tetrahymena thermophila SB210]|uniref:DNA repair protein RAD50, putative n=1 Tax=Tetrahymena thermophila (strain SB210) TaxID=312017 RepID=I7MFI1_TETTS|nr:DNA repair protein RAD50, putative [Tetrahymena thermophila SB210]EAR83969.1 DNA repair protein RAD50, putative [Tetrahymena thermophila SB210]|eukprot:XP_001031632.1 DNA repair protein RAD50, putative [Tetrahymena thermophila SB210]
MSYLKKLGIYGIRSYGDQNSEKYEEIAFFKPLTLILGNNGAGKSTIIECLKLITTGSFPPNSDKGKTFIKDPRLMGSNESQGSISLIFKAINQKQILVRRLFQVKKEKSGKFTFDSKDATIKVRDKNTGKDISVDHKCLEIEKQVPQLLGVSKAVFENVIFCHQDESLWPFGDSATLKSIFDELFDTKQFTKLQETLHKQQKEIKKEASETKINLQHYKQRYDEAVSQKQLIAKEAEDLLQATVDLEKMRNEYNLFNKGIEDEETVRIRIENLNKDICNCNWNKNEMEKQQKQILSSCSRHYFLGEDIDTLKKIQDHLKKENQDLKIKKEEIEESIETEKRDLDKLKYEIENLKSSDKNTKQVHQDLKNIKQKLNEIMHKSIDSDEIMLKEANQYKDQIESEYKTLSFSLKNSVQEYQDTIHQTQQNLQKLQVRQAELKEKKKHSQKRIEQLQEEIGKLKSSNTQKNLEESIQLLEVSKKNSEQYNLKIQEYQDQIDNIRQQNSGLAKQIEIINSQSKMQSKYLELKQMTSQFDEINKTMEVQQKEYEQYQISQDEHLSEQRKQCMGEISSLKQQKSKLESEISKLEGRIELNEDIETAFELKLNQITQTFKESNLLDIIAQDNNADFDTKYQSIKEEIEELKNSIIEKQTCLLIDKQVLNYCTEKKKCKFCKSDVNEDNISKITKSQEDRSRKAEKDIQERIALKEQKIFEKKQLKKLKEQYVQYNELRAKQKKNNSEIKEIQIQVKELQEQLQNLVNQLINKEAQLAKLEKAHTIQSEIIKTQRQIYNLKNKIQKFQVENPELLNIDNQNIIPPEKVEEIHKNYKQNNQRLESLNSLLIQENNKKANSNASFQQAEVLRKNCQNKLKEEQEQIQRNTKDIKDYEQQNQTSLTELQNIEKDIESQNKLLQELKKNVSEQTQELQKVQQTYDQSKILIGEYLPKYEKTYTEYKELKQAKGKQKSKLQENQIAQLEKEYAIKEKSKQQNEEELVKIIEQLKEQTEEFDNLTKGIQYLELGVSISQVEKELAQNEQLLKEQQAILEKIQQQTRAGYDKIQKIKAFEETCKYRKQALEKNYAEAIARYDQAEERYCRALVELEVKNGLLKDIQEYLEELDKTLINYHKDKMEQINKCIADTWKKIYQGQDIVKVEIKAEEAEGRGKKIYNYRIVMFIYDEKDKDLKEIDMKGRCSAGQKVLASIIIRLALAEAFTMNCGILALDEPTTNLDKLHAQKLGEQLCELIESRKGQSSFQLIIISHDKDFIHLMQQRQHCSDFYYVYKENGCSLIERRTYKNALMNKQTD